MVRLLNLKRGCYRLMTRAGNLSEVYSRLVNIIDGKKDLQQLLHEYLIIPTNQQMSHQDLEFTFIQMGTIIVCDSSQF
jgi:hypothetical protein